MSRDLYASLSGAAAAWANLELVGNNLANASTTGFKASRMAFEVVGPGEHPLGEGYAMARTQRPDARDGAIAMDAVATHLALSGDGYFTVGDGSAQVLTRDGRFGLDAAGLLIDGAGRAVQGQLGAIEIPPGETVRVTEDGTVFGSLSGELDRLKIQGGPVRPIGQNAFVPEGPMYAGSARVVQGGLESSNVDPLGAMVDLVQASRYFEAFQKAMQASDELDARLNQLGGK